MDPPPAPADRRRILLRALDRAWTPADRARLAATARSGGAVGARALVPRYVAATARPGEAILDWGCGRAARHVARLRAAGLAVDGFDQHTGPAPLLVPRDLVYASNVLNVQATALQVAVALDLMAAPLQPGGRLVVNYPLQPRHGPLAADEVAALLRARFTAVARVGGTAAAPVWEARRPRWRRPTPRRDPTLGVGKAIGTCLYVHRSVCHRLPPGLLAAAEARLPAGWPYAVVKWDRRTDALSFLRSDDFDTAPEPTVGDSLVVRPDGTVRHVCADVADPWLYHHKWLFVAPDYPGFDVPAAARRSWLWTLLPGVDAARIGRRSVWERTVLPRLALIEDAPSAAGPARAA